MFIARKLSQSTGAVELWRCEWVNKPGMKPHKAFLEKICDEQPVRMASHGLAPRVAAICWSWGRTLGNIAVHSEFVVGQFPGEAGDDAVLACTFVNAGKFRNGAERWWCQTHQSHWGTKGDLQSFTNTRSARCSNHAQRMSYVVNPLTVDLTEYAEVGLWCSLPAAISTIEIRPRAPKLHLHLRKQVGGVKNFDKDVAAAAIAWSPRPSQSGNPDITSISVTPPAAFEFLCGLESNREMSCVSCKHCGYPHLDLGDFARKPHRRHFCGNCGRDSTISSKPIVSTPLQLLREQFFKDVRYEPAMRSIDLDTYEGCTYTIWASTPAIVWTASRPQESGIHVHVQQGEERIVDDTFGAVILKGMPLDRSTLLRSMFSRTIV